MPSPMVMQHRIAFDRFHHLGTEPASVNRRTIGAKKILMQRGLDGADGRSPGGPRSELRQLHMAKAHGLFSTPPANPTVMRIT